MRNLKFIVAILLVATMFSCSKEQSSLDVSSIPTKAIVMGKLCYDAGMSYANSTYVQLIKPVVNQKVTVMVSNEDLSPDGSAEGYTIFETYTNESGDYSIQVPVTTQGTEVIVKPSSFLSEYSEFKSLSASIGSKPEFEKTEKEFWTPQDELILYPNDLEISDFNYYAYGRNYEEEDEYILSFRIYVGEPYYSSSSNTIVKGFKDLNGKEVIVTTLDDSKSYGAKTNAYGYAEFNIPSDFRIGTLDIDVFVEGYTVNSFKYVKKENGVTTDKYISGGTMTYSQYNNSYYTLSFSGINGVVYVQKVKMIFTPYYGVETYGYKTSEWSNVTY